MNIAIGHKVTYIGSSGIMAFVRFSAVAFNPNTNSPSRYLHITK
jgi:hypothetical protein